MGIGDLDAETAAHARARLVEADSVLVPYRVASGKEAGLLLISERAAETLSATLGRFGSPLAVRIFAAVAGDEVPLGDIAILLDTEEAAVAEEAERLVASRFLMRFEYDGKVCYTAGNPALARFFLKKLVPGTPG